MRYPPAIWKPVTRYDVGGANHVPMTSPRRLVYHTAVSGSDSLFGLFNTPGNPVAHFYIREDGTVEQYVDTNVRASAVLDGNPDCITVESWDNAGIRDWTAAQVESCAQLAAWCNEKHGIPLTRLPSSKPGTTGVGWHRLGIDGNFPQPPGRLLGGRVPGGEEWSTSVGKECPGDPKIHGVVDKILPRAIEIANGDDMSAQDVDAITKAVKADGDKTRKQLTTFRANEVKRYQDLKSKIDAIPGGTVDKATVLGIVADALTGAETS